MAAQKTAIADIYEPSLWSQYFVEESIYKNGLISSGIAKAGDPELQDKANMGGRVIDMPSYEELGFDTGTADRSKPVTDTDDAITPDGVTTQYEVAMKDFRAQSWQVANIVKYASGSDPVATVLDKYNEWWRKELQRLTLKKLTGMYHSSGDLYTTHRSDIASEDYVGVGSDANLISTSAILDAKFKLGDAFGQLTSIIMHSVVYKRLELLNLIDYLPNSAQLGSQIPVYFGMRVIVDDNVGTTAGSTSGYKYDTFLFKQGAFSLESVDLAEPNVELYYLPTKGTGGGQTDIITRQQFILHPRGMSFDSTAPAANFATDAELAADNWSKIFENKNIGIIKLVTNG